MAEQEKDFCEIKLSSDQIALVDAEDFERTKGLTWRVAYIGDSRKPQVRCQNIILARHVLGLTDGTLKVYHKNGNYLDCRKANLQLETQGIANHRTDKKWHKSSQYRGVHYEAERGKWRAIIYHMGKRYRLGRHGSEREAALAYDEKARELYGETAHLNILETQALKVESG